MYIGRLSLLTLSMLSNFAFADNFVVLIDKDDNYTSESPISEDITYTNWSIVSDVCLADINEDELYYQKIGTQTTTCTKKEERTKTTTITYASGKELVETETELRSTETVSTEIITGTHLENSCKKIKNSLFNEGTKMYFIEINGNPVNAYCDMDTDGGGWTAVWKNYGGYNASGTNTLSIFSNNLNGEVKPLNFEGEDFRSIYNPELYNEFAKRTNVEILKTSRAYNSSKSEISATSIEHYGERFDVPANYKMDLGENVQFDTMLNAKSSLKLNNQVELYLDNVSRGKTDRLYYQSTSLGFASDISSADRVGESDSNVMNGWIVRHMIYYTLSDNRDAVRCQPICWVSENYKIETVWYFREKD